MRTGNKKPWGHEVLAYQNDNVAIWHLFLNPWQETSMHCHPNKKTGLIVLQGAAQVYFLQGKEKLFSSEKIMIREGVFHKTKNMTNQVLELFEVESPVDKDDLIRFEDKYDRETFYGEEDPIKCVDCYPWDINMPYWIGDCVGEIVTNEYPIQCGNYMMLSGGIICKSLVCSPGDIVGHDTLKKLSDRFETLEGTTFLRIWNAN